MARCYSIRCQSQNTKVYTGTSPDISYRVTVNLCDPCVEHCRSEGWELELQKPCKVA